MPETLYWLPVEDNVTLKILLAGRASIVVVEPDNHRELCVPAVNLVDDRCAHSTVENCMSRASVRRRGHIVLSGLFRSSIWNSLPLTIRTIFYFQAILRSTFIDMLGFHLFIWLFTLVCPRKNADYQ